MWRRRFPLCCGSNFIQKGRDECLCFTLSITKGLTHQNRLLFSSSVHPLSFIQQWRTLPTALQGATALISVSYIYLFQCGMSVLFGIRPHRSPSVPRQHTWVLSCSSKSLFSPQQNLTFLWLHMMSSFALGCEWPGSRLSFKLENRVRALKDG